MRSSSLAVFAAVLFVSTQARAQEEQNTDIDLQDFLPTAGPAEFLTIPSPAVSPHRSVGFGLVVGYVHRPLVLEPSGGGEDRFALRYQTTADFLWSFGLFDVVQLGLALPVVVAQAGEGIQPLDPDAPELASTAIRDIRLDARARLGKHGPASAMAMAVSVSLPSGDEENFAGQSSVTVMPSVLVGGLRLGSRIRLGLSAGARIRATRWIAESGFGSELVGRAGLAFDLSPRLGLSAEYFGSLPVKSDDARQEVLGGLRYAVDPARDVTIELGGGIGLGSAPGTPTFRGIAGVRYAPLGLDSDEDGVLDRTDGCLHVREDRDHFEDGDGCPDPDNDGDGIGDESDRCDDAAEDQDGYQDEDGCPEPDNDGDGIGDADDRCADQAEDTDGFEDEDGCPEVDNDADQVPDASDRCPNDAEDRDSYQDDDGCPDADNDGDGKPDGTDGCPNEAEDVDGFQDDDGCPDPDNDQDGVSDASDQCGGEPESVNGRTDDDGCPDAGPVAARWVQGRLVLRRALRFARGSAALPARSESLLAQVAQLLRGRGERHVVVLGFADSTGAEAPEVLALNRATAVCDALSRAGVASATLRPESGEPARGRTASESSIEIRLPTEQAPAAPEGGNP